jgi:hypothetical protein
MQLGVAKIVSKELKDMVYVSNAEAVEDGFASYAEMKKFMLDTHGIRRLVDGMNKLTLEWIAKGEGGLI